MSNLTKRCPACGETKSESEFSTGNCYCRPCKSKKATERYWASKEYREERKAYHRENERKKRANPEQNAVLLERLRRKRIDNAEWRALTTAKVNARRRAFLGRHLAISAKKRAKARGLECTITPEWVQERWAAGPSCEYCGKELRSAPSKHEHDSATLDRVDTTQGYTVQNIVFACFRCNTLKRDASLEELEELVKNIRRVQANGRH